MIKITYKLILLLGLLAMAVTSFATSEAEYRKVSEAQTLHVNGSQEYRSFMELALLAHTAMNSTYGENFIVYNPDFQTLKTHSSYTGQKDGTIVKAPDNTFVEVLSHSATDAPAYNQPKKVVVVHTGLELRAAIYLDYSIITKPGCYPALGTSKRLQETSPVKEYKVLVSVPEGTPSVYGLYSFPVKAVEKSHNGIGEVHQTLRNIPASSREAFQPKDREASPHLVASTYPSGKAVLVTLDKRSEESQGYESKIFVQFLTDKNGNEQEKVNAIRDHILSNLGTCPIPMAMTGYTVRDIDTVLRSAYDTPLEIARLLNVVLNTVRIPSEVLVVYPGHLDTGACGLAAIQILAVKAIVDGKDQYLSASPLTNRGGLGRVISPSRTSIEIETTPIQIKENRFMTISTDQARGGFAICVLPAISAGIDSWGISALNSKRSNLFELSSLIREKVTYTVTPVESMKLQASTKEQVMSKPFGKVTRTIIPRGNTIEVVRTIELSRQQSAPAGYSDVCSLIHRWTSPDNRVSLSSLQDLNTGGMKQTCVFRMLRV